ncbi:ATP-binding cassette domain-containing protein [Streptomyces sp. Je 1-4]|uniref:ABC transporter ATP-binding protein n=1 Tax=Streptomyces TaxID=1883 RepID=UPI00140F141A|nr:MULTISPECIES: ATP-binding cassette domain-containing protein [unclassified Streptomyces]QIK06109.1 ATP-binding cassette domain-containing protein [Streptomyces sp. ID38640]UYB39457.1 ATP-binding cassette domain-containing protein [Streptomyces sp. Je 1-4]UZQ35489.1 ATP-binding cassette domain-containing protein [Streptomyces sp. Je 1-4] [Streptomyces sp. Je 1-4 4N24]UZQ42907.1 ATP-binding cassette domain-containing protein [Streptomyces sp. Je 1-4] [Streptomyces sp. Je 1-4 4N24_ara]
MTTDDEGGRGRLTGPAGPDEEPHTPAAPAPDAPGPNAPVPDAPGPKASVPDAVTCRALRYAFGETKAVDGVDLSVRTGEVFGLLGPNGAGKTTAIRCITTLLPVPAGMVRVFGHDAAKERMAVRRLLGYVPQQLSADAGLTGRENVALFARVFDVSRRERTARVTQALAAVGLTDAAGRLAKTYSGGMIRRLELAQALVSAPRLLMLDEPTIGLDPIARTSVWEHINAVRAATGMTVLVTTHYMDEADQYCDRLALMHQGRIRALGTPDELRSALRARRRAARTPAAAHPAPPTPAVAPDTSATTAPVSAPDTSAAPAPASAPTTPSAPPSAPSRPSDTEPTLEDVFRDVAGSGLDEQSGDFRDVRSTRRTANRVG